MVTRSLPPTRQWRVRRFGPLTWGSRGIRIFITIYNMHILFSFRPTLNTTIWTDRISTLGRLPLLKKLNVVQTMSYVNYEWFVDSLW